MPIDFHDIADAAKKALSLVDDAERRRFVEQFLDSTGPSVEAAARKAFQDLLDEINDQLAPHARIRLIQEGTRLTADVMTLGEERRRGWMLHLDNDPISKVLVRMPSSVKNLATESAQKAGVSLNSWTVDILERALESLRQRRTNDSENEADSGEDTAKESGQSERDGEGDSGDKTVRE